MKADKQYKFLVIYILKGEIISVQYYTLFKERDHLFSNQNDRKLKTQVYYFFLRYKFHSTQWSVHISFVPQIKELPNHVPVDATH